MEEQKTTFIYGLFDPRDCRLRYIGKSDHPESRLKEHIKYAHLDQKKTHKDYWILQLLKEGLNPSVEILEEVPTSSWKESERAWIGECRRAGLSLTNQTEGGHGIEGYHHTDETKRIISESSKNRQPSEETRARLSQVNPWRGKEGWMKGKSFSEEHKKRISESHLGENNPAYGKRQSPEEVEKRVAPLRGKKRSDEVRKKISEGQMGRKFSEEHREKLRLAWQRRKARGAK